ncbi:MAG: acyltransferase family protein [Acidobacteria bacterium]|nr:acyltransferase family protein [Acidobacteriota bacterium]
MQSVDRLHSLDAVRATALLLGIALHGTIPFLQDMPGWPWNEEPNNTMAAVWYVIHIFRMPVFFLIAGFFGRMVIERRGTRAFIKDRSKRILIPLFSGWLVITILFIVAVILGVIGAVVLSGDTFQSIAASVQQAMGNTETAQEEPAGFSFNWMHLWFLYYLAIFYIIILALRAVFGSRNDRNSLIHRAIDAIVRFVMRGFWGPVLLAFPIAVYFYQLDGWSSWSGLPAAFGLVPQTSAIIGYGIAFGFGWLLHRQMDLLLGLEKKWAVYCLAAVVLTIVCYRIAGSTPRWDAYLEGKDLLIYTSAYMVGVWCWIFGLTGASVRFLSGKSAWRRYVSDSSYWLYLMHAPALCFFHIMFGPLNWYWSVKYLLSIAGSMPILLLSYHYMVRFTFIGAILNGRRHPRVQANEIKA